jgi:DNA invertase Pin-like site-specific DNA recombinase
MDIGYIREFKGSATQMEQEAILRASGLESGGAAHLWIDIDDSKHVGLLPEFIKALDTAKRGDRLMIASAAVLGGTRTQVSLAIEAIGSRGLSIYDASIDASIKWHRSAAEVFALAVRAEAEVRQGITRLARDSKVKLGVTGGRPLKITSSLREKAKMLWDDPNTSVPNIVKKTGISVSTLYRIFGPKSAPHLAIDAAPRGRKPKTAAVKAEKADGEITEMGKRSRVARGADRSTSKPSGGNRPSAGPAKTPAAQKTPKPIDSDVAAVSRRRRRQKETN